MSLLLLSGAVYAQKQGDRISGTVYDDDGPLGLVNVFEVDATSRNVTYTTADANGNFSFVLKNPNNKIKISLVGYKTQLLPINKLRFNIKMQSNTDLGPIVVQGEKTEQGIGLAIADKFNPGDYVRISTEDFEGIGALSVDEALAGRIPGLDIVSDGGDVGAGSSMKLRGVSSITGSSEPLIVVDGNILKQDTKDFDFANADEERFAALLNVNVEDIQSITVSKDGGSTAIWGAQGTNGVIEIKTKRGVVGKTRVSYRYALQGSWQPEGYKLLNGDQYTMLMKEALFNPQLNEAASNVPEFNYDPNYSEYQMFNNNTDWPSAVKRMGLTHQHSVSITGGGEKAVFRASLNYDKIYSGIIKQNADRISTRMNFDYNISDRIVVQSNFNLSYMYNNENYSNLLSIARSKMPNLAIYREDADGNSTGEYYHVPQTLFSTSQRSLANPLALAEAAVKNSSNLTLSPEFTLRYNLLGLSNREARLNYDGRINFNITNSSNYQFYPSSLVTSGWSGSNVNSVSQSSNKSRNIHTRHTLAFYPYLGDKHNVSTSITMDFDWNNSSNQNNSAYGLPNIPSPTVPGTISGMGSSPGESKSMNGTHDLIYTLDKKYTFRITNRLDVTTRLGPKQRVRVQPTFSIKWNAIDEDFMRDLPFITNLSIRASLAFNGVLPGSDYLFFSRYGSASPYNGNPSVAPMNIKLTNLKMADSRRLNLGLDYSVFENKISGAANYYKNTTSNNLQPSFAIPTSSGYPNLRYVNNGEVFNEGWDFNANANNVINTGKFRMTVGFNTSNNRNVLVELDKSILRTYNKEFDFNNGSYLQRIQLNNSLGSIYGFRYKGVYQYSDYSSVEIPGVSGPSAPVVKNDKGEVIFQNNGVPKPMYFAYGTSTEYQFKGGDAIYEDINHDGNINELDIVYLGNSLPLFIGGLNFNMTFNNNLRISSNLQFRIKALVINKARMDVENMYSADNQCQSVNWRWRVEGDKTSIPRALYQTGRNFLGSDRFVEDASFIRMNNITFNYTIDKKIVQQIGLKSTTLALSLNNIFKLTKYSGIEPEAPYGQYNVAYESSKTPRNKQFTFTVNTTF